MDRPAERDPIAHLYDQFDEQGLAEARGHKSPPLRFRASEAADCARAIWYRLTGKRPKPRDGRMAMYGVCGDLDHDATRQLLTHYGAPVEGIDYRTDGSMVENMYVRKEYEVPIPGREGFTTTIETVSRADGEMDTPQGKRLVEIKGTGFYPYKWLNEAFLSGYQDLSGRMWPAGHDAALARVKDKHPKWYAQMQVTMALSGYDDRGAYLIVKDRATGTLGLWNEDTGERTGIYVPFEPDMHQEILDKFAHVKRAVRSGDIPVQGYPRKSKTCEYCDFRWACHGADERREKGLTPEHLYPGPQMEEYHDAPDKPEDDADSSD